MSKNNINIAVIGATGYTGLDLVYMLSKHPRVIVKYLCATKNLGKDISFFDKRIIKKLPKITSIKSINWLMIDLVFLSLPNGAAQKIIKEKFYKFKNIRFIDLSGDFRITNANIYKKSYKQKHKAVKLIKDSIYGLSEFERVNIQKSRIIANPGCYPTSIQLPLLPLIKKKLILNNNFVIDSKSGFSGAGKNLEKKFKHKNLYSSIFAYNTKYHRHVTEVDEQFKKYSKKKIKFTFNPHLLPTYRGILTSIYIDLKKKITANVLRNELVKFYKNEKFIKILKIDTEHGSGNVLNTNNCEISICKTRLKNRILILSSIDNLIKGASGQAIQNMNIMYNFNETMGLK